MASGDKAKCLYYAIPPVNYDEKDKACNMLNLAYGPGDERLAGNICQSLFGQDILAVGVVKDGSSHYCGPDDNNPDNKYPVVALLK